MVMHAGTHSAIGRGGAPCAQNLRVAGIRERFGRMERLESSGLIHAVIIGAGARGNMVFAEMMRRQETGWRVSAVVEPDRVRREAFAVRHGIAAESTFSDIQELLAAPRVADVAFICTPDITHYSICAAVSAAGYDVVLEKPIATSMPDCLALLDVQHTHGN